MPLVTLFLNEIVSSTAPFQKTFTVPDHEGIIRFTVTGIVALQKTEIEPPPTPPPNGNGLPPKETNGVTNGREAFGFDRTFGDPESTVSAKLNGVTEKSVTTAGGVVTLSFDRYVGMGGNTIGLALTAPTGYIATGTFTAQMSYTEPPPPPMAPVITASSPSTVSVVEGANQYVFATAIDTDPSDYEIRVNNTLYDSGTWSSPTTLQYPCAGLALGEHTVSFRFSDQGDLSTARTIRVVVTEAPPIPVAPVITDSSLGIVTITEGDYHFIFATAEDDDPSTYTITVDGTLHESGLWASPKRLQYYCAELLVGAHNIVFRFEDQSALYALKSISVVVTAGDDNGNGDNGGNGWEDIDILPAIIIAGIGIIVTASAWFLTDGFKKWTMLP